MKSVSLSLLLALMASLSASLLWAEESDRYIIDTIYVSLRSGPGNEYRVIKPSMPSGTLMTALSQSDDKEWTQVRLRDSEALEGWIPSRYISNKKIAKDQLAAASSTIASLRAQLENTAPSEPVSEPDAAGDALIEERDALLEELNNLKVLAANVIGVDQTNSELLIENQELKTELDILRIENQVLTEANRTREWMIGGVIAFIGLLVGLVLSRMGKPSRRSDSWA